MNAEKSLWPIFGCKVGQSVPIGMKLELDVWHYLKNLYTMFQIDISKHVEKNPENFTKSKTHKNNGQNSENTIFAKNRTMSRSIQWAIYLINSNNLPWFIRPRLQNWVWLTFGCKLVQSDPIIMKLKLHRRATYWMHIPSFKLISQSMLKKSPENSDGRPDGRTEGRTDRHCHGIIRLFFKRAYKK